MNTCQNAAYTTSNNVDCNPNPNTSTANGINATDGTGRRNSTVDAVTRRSTSTLPSSMPTAPPPTPPPPPQPVHAAQQHAHRDPRHQRDDQTQPPAGHRVPHRGPERRR